MNLKSLSSQTFYNIFNAMGESPEPRVGMKRGGISDAVG